MRVEKAAALTLGRTRATVLYELGAQARGAAEKVYTSRGCIETDVFGAEVFTGGPCCWIGTGVSRTGEF